MRIDIYHHQCDDGNDEVLKLLRAILAQGEKIMALVDELKAGIAELDAETTNVATRIDALIAKLTSESLTPEQKAEVLASLGAETARLKTLAADPVVVVPPVPVALAAARAAQRR